MIAPQSHSGFYKTTITKCCLAFSIIFSFVLNLPFAKQKDVFTYNLDDIFINWKVWKLIPSKLAFHDMKDLICGSLLFYYFRIFERRYGPRKFLSYLLYSVTIATAIELVAAYLLRRLHFSFHVLPSGPYSVIFPLFVPYCLEIPWVPVAYVLGVPITGKSFLYIFGLQLATSSAEAMLLSACGLLAGVVYHKNFFHVQTRWMFPKRIVRFGCDFIGPIVETAPPEDLYHPIGATLEIQHLEELDRRESLLGSRRIGRQAAASAGSQASVISPPSG